MKNRENPKKDNIKKDNTVKYTEKGNKLIEFSRVSNEERNRLKVDVYGYIL